MSTGRPEGVPSDAVDAVWARYHSFLAPFRAAKRLGVVLFQFQASFTPSEASRHVVEECRRRLQADIPMAIEFRSRLWTSAP